LQIFDKGPENQSQYDRKGDKTNNKYDESAFCLFQVNPLFIFPLYIPF